MNWTTTENFTVLDFILEGTSAEIQGSTIIINENEKQQIYQSLCNNKLENKYSLITR